GADGAAPGPGRLPLGRRADPPQPGPPPDRGGLRGHRGHRGAAGVGAGPEAVPDGAYEHLEEELGDLVFQVVFHATLAREAGAFTITDVLGGIHDKLVRRHPHVFADVAVSGADEVVANWEVIKREEKGRASLMDGVSRHLPSLLYAHKLYRKAGSAGLTFGTAGEAAARAGAQLDGLAAPAATAGRPRPRPAWARRWPPSSTWPGWRGSTASRPCGAGPGASRPGSRRWRRKRRRRARPWSRCPLRRLPPSGSRRPSPIGNGPWSGRARSARQGCTGWASREPFARLTLELPEADEVGSTRGVAPHGSTTKGVSSADEEDRTRHRRRAARDHRRRVGRNRRRPVRLQQQFVVALRRPRRQDRQAGRQLL